MSRLRCYFFIIKNDECNNISIKIDKYLESENNYLIEENDNFLIEKV